MLSTSLGNALSGLKANQAALAVISQNVANANNVDYSRQAVTQESISLGGIAGNGVQTKEIRRVVDEFVAKAVVTRNSDYNYTSSIKNYYTQVQQYFGKPGASNSIDSYVNNFFNSLNTLQNNPKDSSIKLSAVAAAQNLSGEISTLANNIQATRFEADRGIQEAVNNVNFLVSQLQTYNKGLLTAKTNNASIASIMDSIQATLNKLSGEIDINYQFQQDGTVAISTTAGYNLLNGINRYELSYAPSLSAQDFINKVPSNEIALYSINPDGKRAETPTNYLATAGVGSEVTTSISSGRIKALMEVRDTLLPNMLDQLDNLASNLRDEVNALHNRGSAFPPRASLTGETLINPTQPRSWSGSVMIAALKEDGTPIQSSYASDNGTTGMPPLTLDLGSLNDGNGNGITSMQTVIDEINRYYGAPQTRVGLGPLKDIKLASTSEALDGNSGTFSFNLEMANYSLNNASVVVTGVAVNNGAVVSSPATFPTTAYTAEAGKQGRGFGFTLDMSGGTNTNYAVSVNVEVTDSNGNVTTDTITYNISEATSDLMNNRYSASSISGAGDAVMEAPVTLNPVMVAKLVDDKGVEVPKDPATGDYLGSGYLVLEGRDGTRVALSELNSKDNGLFGVNGSGRGFSHTLGLNNFFKATDNLKENSAVNFAVRDDIKAQPTLIAIGQLSRSNTDPAIANYTYEIGESSTSVIRDMLEINMNNHNFSGAGTLPAISVTFSGYASQILGFLASKTAEAETNAAQSELIYSGFVDRDQNVRGVNIDEEMANTIIFQNAYAANARVITVVNKLFEDLLAVF